MGRGGGGEGGEGDIHVRLLLERESSQGFLYKRGRGSFPPKEMESLYHYIIHVATNQLNKLRAITMLH